MNAKEYLKQYKLADSRIKKINEKLCELRTRMEGVNSSIRGDVIQGTVRASALEELMERYIELEEEAQAELEKLLDKKIEVRATIHKVPKPNEKALLLHRYIDDKSWDWIAEKLHYSLSYVRGELRSKALITVTEILRENT